MRRITLCLVLMLSCVRLAGAEPEEWRQRLKQQLVHLSTGQQPDGTWADAASGEDPTPLVCLAFLGAGYDHKTPNMYRQKIEAALATLTRTDPSSGTIAEQALRTMVLAEAYAMTADPELLETVGKRLHVLDAASLPTGGWPIKPGGPLDWRSTALVIMAMKSAAADDLQRPTADIAAWWLSAAGDDGKGGLDQLAWKTLAGCQLDAPTRERTLSMRQHLMERLPAGPIPPAVAEACAISCRLADEAAWDVWEARELAMDPIPASTTDQAWQMLADLSVDRHRLFKDKKKP